MAYKQICFSFTSQSIWELNTASKANKIYLEDIGFMKRIVANENVDQVNDVLNAVVMEESMLNRNVIHVDLQHKQLGRIIQEVVHAMGMLVKHRTNNVMIVMDVVINKNKEQKQTNIFLCRFVYFFSNSRRKKKMNELINC